MGRRSPRELGLGPLEAEAMAVLWRHGPAKVAAVREQLNRRRTSPLAHTTVLAVLTNLETKAVVSHRVEGNAYRFEAVLSEDELLARQARIEATGLVRRYRDVAVSAFVGEVSDHPQLLAALRDMLDDGDETSGR